MSGLLMKYFVLKPESKEVNDDYAFASRKAMLTFALYCNNEALASDLREWVAVENNKVCSMMQSEAKAKHETNVSWRLK